VLAYLVYFSFLFSLFHGNKLGFYCDSISNKWVKSRWLSLTQVITGLLLFEILFSTIFKITKKKTFYVIVSLKHFSIFNVSIKSLKKLIIKENSTFDKTYGWENRRGFLVASIVLDGPIGWKRRRFKVYEIVVI